MVSGQEHPLLAEGGALLAGAVASALIGPVPPPRCGPGPGPPPPPGRPGGPPPDRWEERGPGGPPGRFDEGPGNGGIRRF